MQVIPRCVARLGLGLALALGGGVCAIAQAQVGSYLRLDAQVVGPSGSATLNSTNDLSGGDLVQWNQYFASRTVAPWTGDAEQVLPAGFTWQGQLKKPPNTTMKWQVGGLWQTSEPAVGTAVTALGWRTDPMIRINFASTPQSTNFQGTGDGFRIIPYKKNFYVVNHHAVFNPDAPEADLLSRTRPLNCRTALEGTLCAGFPADGAGVAFVDTPGTALGKTSTLVSYTPFHSMDALNYKTGELFVGVDTPNGTQVVCTNLDTLKSCGAWLLGSAFVDNGLPTWFRSRSVPVDRSVNLETIGSKYFVLDVGGDLHCFDIETKAICGKTSYKRDQPAAWPDMRLYTSSQLSGKLFFAFPGTMYCHDPQTNSPCTGWPSAGKTIIESPSGGVVPVPDALGAPIGVCGSGASVCYRPDGKEFTLSEAAQTFVKGNSSWVPGPVNSSAVVPGVSASTNFNAVKGSRIYMLPQDGRGVSCFDFATDAVCPGFPISPTLVDKAYTTRFDPLRPDCLLTVGDSAIAYQINVNTRSSCSDPGAATDPKTLQVTPADYYKCDPTNAQVTGWDSVRLSPTLAWGGLQGLSEVRVTLRGDNGELLPAAYRPNRTFSRNDYSLDISDVPYGLYPKLTVVFQMFSDGILNSDKSVGVDVTWKGPPHQLCFQTKAPSPADCETTSRLTATFALATDPDTPLETVVADKVLWSGVGSEGYAAGAAATSIRALTSDLSSSEPRTYLLQGRYDLKTFSGDVWGLPLDASEELNVDKTVNASTSLPASGASTRPMYMSKPSLFGSKGLISTHVLNPWSVSVEQLVALSRGLDGRPDSKPFARLNYLRGIDGSSGFRERGGRVLGPVINSAPVLIPQRAIAGLSEANHPGYTAFRSDTVRAYPMVVWGGNDGAVHAAEVKSGKLEEAWSLVPDVMLRKAAKFSDTTLAGIRLSPYFVDNLPMVGHADIGSTAGPRDWRTVAVVTFGRGARAITAIDVTKTKLSEGEGVLFEYTNKTDSDLNDLGYIVSSPISDEALGSHQIVKLNNNRWAVLVGNGIGSNDQTTDSGPGRPVLYAFYLDKAEPRWHRFVVEAAPQTNNGLSTPRPVDVNGDGKVDVVYAGDVQGNLWRFNLQNVEAPTVSKLYAAGAERPIFGAPVAVRNGRSGVCPATQVGGCWQVTFGTGAYLSPLLGTTNTTQQRIVSILDPGDGRTTVVEGALVTLPSEIKTSAAGVEFRFTAGAEVDYIGGKRGWQIALGSREQTVSSPMLLPNGQLRLSTVRPTGAASTVGGQCLPARSWLFQADPVTGPPSADSFDFNNDGILDEQDRQTSGATTVKRPPLAMAVSGAQFATPGLLLARSVAANSAYLVFPSLNIDTGTNNAGAAGSANVPGVTGGPKPSKKGLVRVSDRKTLGRVSWRRAR